MQCFLSLPLKKDDGFFVNLEMISWSVECGKASVRGMQDPEIKRRDLYSQVAGKRLPGMAWNQGHRDASFRS